VTYDVLTNWRLRLNRKSVNHHVAAPATASPQPVLAGK